jgi:hypothetical protein
MKQKLSRLLLILLIIPVVLMTSCKKIPAGASDTTPVPASTSASQESETPNDIKTDWDSGVKTDYSGLTDYKPPREIYTRLSDGPLDELQPSDHYGKLLPYIGETMYISEAMYSGPYSAMFEYGLMTEEGMIVTDPLYSNIYHGYYYSHDGVSKSMPAYHLEIMPESVDEEDPWSSVKHAVCALDGSWITPFDYSDVFFTDQVILLVRDREKNDIDVMDYSGNLMYNFKSLPCYSKLPGWLGYSVYSSYGEGMFVLTLDGSSIAIVDTLTGETVFMEYEAGLAFSDGLAAVMKNGLYGFIDKTYTQVIEPSYLYTDYFIGGLNTVTLPDESGAVIDMNGKQLLNSHSHDIISRWGPDSYVVFAGNNSSRFYDDELNEVKGPEGSEVFYLNDGWYYYTTSDGAVVTKDGEEHFLPGVSFVSSVFSGLVSCSESGDVYKSGVMSLDGKEIFPLSQDMRISFAESKKTGDIYCIGNSYGYADNAEYAVYNRNGSALFSGNGYIVYNQEFELFLVNDEVSFSYKDFSGNDIFRISLLQFIPD